ncbi:hypothetical protein BB560_000566 [Smittium megazygosporum]|uniref:SH3 domain-containing protein n=1 Tax=Smittium megazygosporum TaxID=133381 RepID=A0A2T9ZJW8_9FUNG|nr:hypothetical protein BB560_000566 [Smittium megazygosporum]
MRTLKSIPSYSYGNYLLLVLGLILSIVGCILQRDNIINITIALIALVGLYAIFLGYVLYKNLIYMFRLVILAYNVFFMSILFGNINFYITASIPTLQILSSGLLLIFCSLFAWTITIGMEQKDNISQIGSVSYIQNPRKYTTSLISQSIRSPHSSTANNVGIPVVLRCVALYSYEASEDDPTEMSFVKGEILDILDNSGKWWQARRADGAIGIVPSF